MTVLLTICLVSLLSSIAVDGAASSWPAPIPLFHKSPYFNAWVNASNNVTNSPGGRWPEFYSQEDLGWFIGVRVDNVSYMIQGDDAFANYTTGSTIATYVTSTQTRFTIAAGPVLVNVTYLAPIELQDWEFHSVPFAYAALDVISKDGNPHAVQLYTDTPIQFVSSNVNNIVTWNTSLTAKSIYHMSQPRTLRPLTEINEMSEDGTQVLAYSATPGASMTWQTCSSVLCRANFALHGKLDNSSDTDFRAISDNWPVLAFALDLGSTITRSSNTLVFGIGLIRNPVVSYRTVQTTQSLSHLWYSKWSDVGSAIDEFLASYSSASSRANAFDDRVQLNATTLSSQLRMSTSAATNFVDLHILNLRQTIGSLEFTTSKYGQPLSIDDVRVFMKDVGYSRRTSPVEILYASFPAFLFLNTTLAGKLLEPLLEFQASPLYKNGYAAPDLGNSYPVIQGNTTDQSLLAIDSGGSMLIMALAHARKSGDGTMLFKYYDLLQKWADYLVQSTQQPGSYMSSDLLYSSNANLELKGIMGLYAMGKINNILETRGADPSKTSYYLNTANAYSQAWQKQAVASDHIMASYGANSTWAMMYNLFSLRLLGANILPEQIYETEAAWYSTQSENAATFGLPYDSTQALAKAHWTLLSASSVFNATTSAGRDGLINMVHSRSFWQAGLHPNPASYSPIDGTIPAGAASPAMGAIYSLLALNLPDLAITLPSGSLVNSQSASSRVPVIVGATVGVLGGFLLVATIVFILRRRKGPETTNGPPETLGRSLRGKIMPWTSGVKPPVTDGFQEQRNMRSRTPPIRHPEKFNLSPVPVTCAAGSVASGSRDGGNGLVGGDENLRREVEELRRAVTKLSAQQLPQVVYQPGLPDEPPPMYPCERPEAGL